MTVTWIDIQLRIAFPIPIPCYIIYGISEACLEQSSFDAKAIVKSFISCRILQVFIASFPGHLWGTWERGHLDYKHHHTSFSKPVGNLYMAQVSLSYVHTHSSLQIVDCISEALCIVETPLPMKIARLYLTNTHTHTLEVVGSYTRSQNDIIPIIAHQVHVLRSQTLSEVIQ